MNETRSGLLACLLVAGAVPCASAQEELPPLGQGELRTLSVLPEKALLRGEGSLQQLVITGHFANGGVRDLTEQAKFRIADAKVADVYERGLVTARHNGTTEVRVEAAGKTLSIVVNVDAADRDLPINFTNQVVPIFSKLGCNAGACHGKSTGQNGFRLSLLGFEPAVDYDALAREGRGRRTLPTVPEASLLLRKPTGQMPHGGGRRLSVGSRDYQILLRWIRAGMPFGQESDPKVIGLSVAPAQRLIAPKSSQQITVSARFSDGSSRDVSADAEYSSNSPEIATVAEGGLVRTNDIPGEAAVMVRYLGHVGVFRGIVPQDAPLEKYAFPAPANFIDEHVLAKLKQLGVPPRAVQRTASSCAARASTLRRRSRRRKRRTKFLAMRSRQARQAGRRVLSRPCHASYFALTWGDVAAQRDGLVGVGGGSGPPRAWLDPGQPGREQAV
ncbi:MAG: hypothetical protein U0793_31445 [Gemmataceae bacterium]